MKIYLNTTKNKNDPRKIVEAVLVKNFKTTMLVRLPDGNIIRRKKKRDLPETDEK